VVKQRLQVQGSLEKKTYKNSFQALKWILKHESWRGLFVSIHAAVLRDAPYAATYFTSYELLKAAQRKIIAMYKPKATGTQTPLKSTSTEAHRSGRRGREDEQDSLGTINHLIAGSLSGIAATTVSIPFDVIKTRLQTQAILKEHPSKYNGVIDAAKKIIAEEGWKGLRRYYDITQNLYNLSLL
jgi:hypothetical protein